MKKLLVLWAALCLGLPAFAGPPSVASIEKLLAITRAESMVDAMFSQMEQSIRTGMSAVLQGRDLTPEQQKVLDITPAKLAAAMREEFNWATLKPMYLEIYRDTLDQADVDGMIAFYQTPAGQAMLSKMPAVMQRSMVAMQTRMQGLTPRIQAAMKEALAEAGVRE